MKFVVEFGITRGHENRILKGGGIGIRRPGSLSIFVRQLATRVNLRNRDQDRCWS
jgi:hypothetical protein